MDGHYLLKKNVRDICVFASHNFLKDPPFAKMDFISCRNVLIYMESYLQRKALGTFHYALNEKGMLLLGKSETAGNAPELFKVIGKHEKLYARKPTAKSARIIPEGIKKITRSPEREKTSNNNRKEDFHKNADDILLSKYTPPGVVVNEHLEIVQFRGSTGAFLEAAPGRASLNILKMAREGLSFEIRTALHKARESKETTVKTGIPIHNGQTLINIEVVPLLQTIEPHYLILFHEQKPAEEYGTGIKAVSKKPVSEAEQQRIQQLEKDLTQLREDMRTITEDQEAANEELQSANEELLSGSEELQSLNEELETSKEELQSTNEELMTVNQELYERNEQYNQARLYAEAIVATIREPLLVLSRDLRIRSANNSFYETFNLREEEITGRILFELKDNSWDIPALRSPLLKIQTAQSKQEEWEVEFDIPGAGKRIMILNSRQVSPGNNDRLILLALHDITLLKNEAKQLKASAEKLKLELDTLENFFQQAPAMFCILKGPELLFEFVNPTYITVSGGTSLIGKRFEEAFPELGNEGYSKILKDVYNKSVPFLGREMKATRFPGSNNPQSFIDVSCQPLRNSNGDTEGVLFFAYEVTDSVLNRKTAEKSKHELEREVHERTSQLRTSNELLEQSNKNLQEFASIASHDLQEPLRKIKTFTSILKDRFETNLPPEAKQLIEKTQLSVSRMSSLIKDVLNYSRIVVPENSFEITNLNSILKEVIADFDLLMEEKKAEINVRAGIPDIEAIRLQMNQLFYNLVGNSLKFSSKLRLPVIDINWRRADTNAISEKRVGLLEDKDYIEIIFKDNGIGFNEEFAEQVFSIFERLNNIGEYEGTGIGLALCRKIVNNHHGIIWAESEEEKGASFHIVLPMQQ